MTESSGKTKAPKPIKKVSVQKQEVQTEEQRVHEVQINNLRQTIIHLKQELAEARKEFIDATNKR